MYEHGWKLRSYCRQCRTELELPWPMVIRTLGPNYVLWNRMGKCRKVMCSGQVEFRALPDPRAHWQQLVAPTDRTPEKPAWLTAHRP